MGDCAETRVIFELLDDNHDEDAATELIRDLPTNGLADLRSAASLAIYLIDQEQRRRG